MKVCYTNENAVILIPDISGFTKYVVNSDPEHSQDKIAQLLETILDNNILNFEVSEIEGDAILFYSLRFPNSGSEITEQCRLMFSEFHKKIMELRSDGCNCSSCKMLDVLSLKFIVHYGILGSIMVKNYCKLFGRDLIIAHRLLKNNVNSKEYILFTESFTKHFNYNNAITSDNTTAHQHSIQIQDVGKVNFSYLDLLELKVGNDTG